MNAAEDDVSVRSEEALAQGRQYHQAGQYAQAEQVTAYFFTQIRKTRRAGVVPAIFHKENLL